MFDILLPILLFMVPVLAVVVLAAFFGRRLRGSCGGVGTEGSCPTCGLTADERAAGDGSGNCGQPDPGRASI